MNIDASHFAESGIGRVIAWQMIERLGNTQLESKLDDIRRAALLAGKKQLAEEARAWLEFSRATTRFQERVLLMAHNWLPKVTFLLNKATKKQKP